MTRSYKKTIWNMRGEATNYEKRVPLLMGGHWLDLTNKEEETEKILKRTVYNNRDGTKKHGEFLIVKDGKSVSMTCPKHNVTHHFGCDWAEKYVPPCKTNEKFKLVKGNVRELE